MTLRGRNLIFAVILIIIVSSTVSNAMQFMDRPTGNFLSGRAVNHLPTNCPSCPNFTKQSKRKEGHMMH